MRRALAFEMVVIAHDPFIASQMADDLGIELVALDLLAERADFITLHLPSTDSTRGLLNRALLARCRPGARVINTARGRPCGRGGARGGDRRAEDRRRRTRCLPAGASRRHDPDRPGTGGRDAAHRGRYRRSPATRQPLGGHRRPGVPPDGFRPQRGQLSFDSPPDELRGLRPYLVLAERLGQPPRPARARPHSRRRPALLWTSSRISRTRCWWARPWSVSSGRCCRQTVTLVNARAAAEQRGLEIVESRSSRPRNFTSLVSLKLHTSDGELWAEGALFEPGQPRLVRLDGVEVEAPLEGTLIVIRNRDQPGVIGEVGLGPRPPRDQYRDVRAGTRGGRSGRRRARRTGRPGGGTRGTRRHLRGPR